MASNSYDSNSMSKVTQFQKMNNYFIKYNKWIFSKNRNKVFIAINKCFCLLLLQFHPFKRIFKKKSWKQQIIREFRIESYDLSTI